MRRKWAYFGLSMAEGGAVDAGDAGFEGREEGNLDVGRRSDERFSGRCCPNLAKWGFLASKEFWLEG